MANVHRLFQEYSRSHVHPVNKRIHWICVPAIYWSVYALLLACPTPAFFVAAPIPLHWGLVAVGLVQAYYFVLSSRLGLGLLLFHVLLVLATGWLGPLGSMPIWQLALGVFGVAWVGQFIGHYIEGARPSFFKDVQFLLVGPAWLLGHVYRRLGWSF